MLYSLCDGWSFTESWSDEFLSGGGSTVAVRLPHTCRELPLHCIDPEDYQMLCGYRRTLTLPEDMGGKRLFLRFDGAAHIATVFVNGHETATHRCGYTGFQVEITDLVAPGTNQIAVRLDTTEDPSIPPFGFVVDYLTYGGLYREVWLDVREQSYIDDIYITTPDLTTAAMAFSVKGPDEALTLAVTIRDGQSPVWQGACKPGEALRAGVPGAIPWDTEDPRLYTCVVSLRDRDGVELDRQEENFGFRTAVFRADGFYLSGKKTFLRGLNRHQSYPYVGYAAPESMQREDARILKRELGVNAVRTSHYPQSQYFLDECDRLGLLVFTELPGWQHIGDEAWKDQAVENVRKMVLQNRNHPSIILWGVRINESLDDDAFYTRTNALCHKLDPSRATGGVRYIEKSSLLEDVYAYNDFSHDGATPGARPKKAVTPDMEKALLISEHSGHMFPTKAWDSWAHRQEHALRHVRVLDAALQSGGHAGCFGWCMFDYPTHKDFGSGDRICYHGVMDAFRNPKLAAAVYASQQEDIPVLAVGSAMDIGDYAAGRTGEVYVFSNADSVSLYKNDVFVTELSREKWTGLAHPPFSAADTIGELLVTREGFEKPKADAIKDCLLAAGRYGLAGLPAKYKLKLAGIMARYHMTFDDGVALYGKYVGNWGGEATRWRFDAVKDGRVVKSVTCAPSTALRLEVTVSHTELTETASYDMAAVRVRVLDENGNIAPYAQIPVAFDITGDAALVGPEVVTAEGGMCGTYIRSLGRSGTARLTVSSNQTMPVFIDFTVTVKEDMKWI